MVRDIPVISKARGLLFHVKVHIFWGDSYKFLNFGVQIDTNSYINSKWVGGGYFMIVKEIVYHYQQKVYFLHEISIIKQQQQFT